MNKYLDQCAEIHNNKYDYSHVVWLGSQTKITIICPLHGSFSQLPTSHKIKKQGCPSCAGVRKMDTTDFVSKAKLVHGGRYDYSLVDYKGNKSKVKIICAIHGVFEQNPNNHLSGQNCTKCAGKFKLEPAVFLSRCREKHGDKYDYSLVNYTNAHQKIKIICSEHGVFEQGVQVHLSGAGCSKCSGVHNHTNEEFIQKAKLVHKDKYSYFCTEYTNKKSKVAITCKIHGLFYQNAAVHLRGCGCPKCGGTGRSTLAEFIDLANSVHSNTYTYSNSIYKNQVTPLLVTCSHHGDFEIKPLAHIQGVGCPKCRTTSKISKGEAGIKSFLEERNIQYVVQKTFKDCIGKKKLRFDFYLPEHNTCIEYDGIQHFQPVDFFGGQKGFDATTKNDSIKTRYCLNNNITLVRIAFNEDVEDRLGYIQYNSRLG